METLKISLKGSAGIAAVIFMGLIMVFATSDVAFAREGKVGAPGAVTRDRDNNPPGPRGGQGSNWEKNDFRRGDRDNNPPGPRGGQGTNWEKNDFRRGDRDNNPPGPRGGQGTNWEKNDFRRGDLDNNPPGPRGGQGTNWEKNDYRRFDNNPNQDNPNYRDNPPGPRGGQGTDWKRPEAGSTAGQSEKGFENRKERFEQFLEKHPDAEKKMDRNGDGTVDDLEKKQGYEKMLQERHGYERRDSRVRQGGNNEPSQNEPEAGTPK